VASNIVLGVRHSFSLRDLVDIYASHLNEVFCRNGLPKAINKLVINGLKKTWIILK